MNKIRVGIAPWSYMNPDCFPSEETGCNAGIELDILHTVAKLANLRIELIVSNSTGCGGRAADGSWTGLLKLLHDGVIDMTGNLCGVNKISQQRDRFYSTSWPVWQYQEQFVIQAPTPPPLSFALFAPLTMPAWIAYGTTILIYLAFVTFYLWITDKSIRSISDRIQKSIKSLSDVFFGFTKDIPFQLIWPLWLLLMLSFFQFYNTFILSAVLYPFPVLRPFTNSEELAKQLLSGKYRLLAYRDPPPVPDGCLGKRCEADIKTAIQQHGFEYIVNASGYNILSAIVDQDHLASSKLVLVQGMPFVNLYLSEYTENRNKLWIIDNGFENWSVYVWRQNFTHARKMDRYLREIGEFKYYALFRAARNTYGNKPQTGTQISETPRKQAIELRRLRSFYLLYFCGVMAGVVSFLGEWMKFLYTHWRTWEVGYG